MKTNKEIEELIKYMEDADEHILTGSIATIESNAPRALMQIEAETKLKVLHWVLGTKFKSKLKGIDC